MRLWKKLGLIFIVLGCCIGCDQTTKQIARHALQYAPPLTYGGDLLRLHYAENPGGFLSLGAKLPETARTWLFIVLPGMFLGGILGFLIRSRTLPAGECFALLLFIGGGGSNLLDRIWLQNRVIDFLNLGIGALRTGIFNVADVLILIGAGLLLCYKIRETERRFS